MKPWGIQNEPCKGIGLLLNLNSKFEKKADLESKMSSLNMCVCVCARVCVRVF